MRHPTLDDRFDPALRSAFSILETKGEVTCSGRMCLVSRIASEHWFRRDQVCVPLRCVCRGAGSSLNL
jgi:hypothetical protein